tara:strand:- start:1035 stop:2288 length:1254 start_codon:yes stop_codon:yes gene_type:complete
MKSKYLKTETTFNTYKDIFIFIPQIFKYEKISTKQLKIISKELLSPSDKNFQHNGSYFQVFLFFYLLGIKRLFYIYFYKKNDDEKMKNVKNDSLLEPFKNIEDKFFINLCKKENYNKKDFKKILSNFFNPNIVRNIRNNNISEKNIHKLKIKFNELNKFYNYLFTEVSLNCSNDIYINNILNYSRSCIFLSKILNYIILGHYKKSAKLIKKYQKCNLKIEIESKEYNLNIQNPIQMIFPTIIFNYALENLFLSILVKEKEYNEHDIFGKNKSHNIYKILKSNKKIFESIIFKTYSQLFNDHSNSNNGDYIENSKNKTLKELKLKRIDATNIEEIKKINFLINFLTKKYNKESIYKYFEIIADSYNTLRYFDINILDNFNKNNNIDIILLKLEKISVNYNINFELFRLLNNFYIEKYS